MMVIFEVSPFEAMKIKAYKGSAGLFWYYDNGKYIGIDNITGNPFSKEFDSKESCITWLEAVSVKHNLSDLERQYESLLKRFRHLLKSDTIRQYDEVNPRTGLYKYNPLELDLHIKRLESTIISLTIENIKLKEAKA